METEASENNVYSQGNAFDYLNSNVDFTIPNNNLDPSIDIRRNKVEACKVSKPPDQYCSDCSFWKLHPCGYPNEHKSCICELFANQSICCQEGYSNLMWKVPYMILYAPTPNKYIYQTTNPYTNPIQLNSDKVIEIVNFSNNLKLNILPKLNFPYKNYHFKDITTPKQDGNSQYDIENTF